MILNIHGYGSNGENTKFIWLKANVTGHEIISPTIDYDREMPEEIFARLAALIKDADASGTFIVGTSLGGSYAARLHAARPDITTILVNPSLMPFVTLRKYDVPMAALRRYFEHFEPTFEHFTSGRPDERLHVIYGDADEVIAHDAITLPLLPDGVNTYRIEGGDHRMPVEGKFAETMKKIIN